MKQVTVIIISVHLSVGWFLVQGFVQSSSSIFQKERGSSTRKTLSYQRFLQQLTRTTANVPRYVAVDRHFSHDVQDNSSSSAYDYSSHEQSLWFFVHHLQKERREKRLQKTITDQQQPPTEKSKKSDPPRIQHHHHHPAKSLVSFLSKNILPTKSDEAAAVRHHHQQQQQQQQHLLIEPFSRAVVQAIRLASELGDYKLILHLVEASILYANGRPILIPRLFGEAIDGLAKTSANIAKIKQVWNLGTSEQAKYFLTEPVGTFELNVMIKAIASRGKIRAALDIYQEYTTQQPSNIPASVNRNDTVTPPSASTTQMVPITNIEPDAYTLSSIFSALHDSITDEQALKSQEQDSDVLRKENKIYSSRCWQWNEAMALLDSYVRQGSWPPLNNHVFSSLLKLNDRVSRVYPPASHNGPRMALALLDTMRQLKISPDVVTCTLLISNLGYQWKTAVNLLYAMKTAPRDSHATWKLPRPNVYTYSAVITICAHCHQYQIAMDLLQEMRKDDSLDSPNTWVYNAALLATTRSDSLAVLTSDQQHRPAQKQKRNRERLHMALKLLREMQNDTEGNCSPDTVTYNTVLATLDGIASAGDLDGSSVLVYEDSFLAAFFDDVPLMSKSNNPDMSLDGLTVHCLLDEMEQNGIPRDSITYRNAILAVRSSDNIRISVWRILERALLDNGSLTTSPQNESRRRPIQTGKITGAGSTRQLEGRAAEGISFVFDTALTVLASHGDIEGVLSAFSKWLELNKRESTRAAMSAVAAAQVHFINALGRAKWTQNLTDRSTALIPMLLCALKGDRAAEANITEHFVGINKALFQSQALTEELFSAAISSCLGSNDIINARKVLTMMKNEGLQPSDTSLQEIVRTYARLAMVAASEEAKAAQVSSKAPIQNKKVSKTRRQGSNSGDKSLARARAQNAFSIATKTLVEPPPALLSTVARTCASLGMWSEARFILNLLHNQIPSDIDDLATFGAVSATQAVLPGLQNALLRASSIQGNVTAALWYAEDIQKLTKRLPQYSKAKEDDHSVLSLPGAMSSYGQGPQGIVAPSLAAHSASEALRMSADDWKLLIIAASKCGHWRVCLSTLQFLRPYLEETHPSSLGITVEERSRRYKHLAPALTVAVKCLEVRSQYGWAVRAIDDWIEWCGRRPPKAAVLAAVKVLSTRGRGAEVNNLLARCTSPESASLVTHSESEDKYHLSLYVGAITALHNEGLYDDADDAFIAAVSGNFLPFDLYKEVVDSKRRMVLDLHGMNVAVAHSAVRVALQQEVEIASWAEESVKGRNKTTADRTVLWDDDLVIVTGRGLNSAFRMRPVLRPEVQRMLVEEFYPPLSTTSTPGNMGAVRIPAADISSWLSHQRRQKGSRMLAIASVLKKVSSIDRLKESIAKKIQSEEAGQ